MHSRFLKFILINIIFILGFPMGNLNNARAKDRESVIALDPSTTFVDYFDGPTLDPAWQVVEFTGTRVYGYTSPANHISLTDNPGYLRYYVDPMTYPWGYINNYYTWVGYYLHDPGLELHRPFSGGYWRFETKANYYLPYTNGRGEYVNIYFGDGGENTYALFIQRYRDVEGSINCMTIGLIEKYGPSYIDQTFLENYNYYEDIHAPAESTYFYRLERNGSRLSASWSSDGVDWTLAFNHNLGVALNGLEQRLVITGLSWFDSAGSYADYDYVQLNPLWSMYLPVVQR